MKSQALILFLDGDGVIYEEYGNAKCGTQQQADAADLNNQKYTDMVNLLDSPNGIWGGVSGSNPNGYCDWAQANFSGTDTSGEGYVTAKCPRFI